VCKEEVTDKVIAYSSSQTSKHTKELSQERRSSHHSDSSTSETSDSDSDLEMDDATNVTRTIRTDDVPSNITN
ncbi:unnamed protein product, partial [Cochlearia groenlandica]